MYLHFAALQAQRWVSGLQILARLLWRSVIGQKCLIRLPGRLGQSAQSGQSESLPHPLQPEPSRK